MVGFSWKRSTAVGGAQSVEKTLNGERPTGHWWHKQVPSASQANVSNARAVPQGLCENLINALKLLAKQQKDGDSPIQSIVARFCERNKKGTIEGLRNFISS